MLKASNANGVTPAGLSILEKLLQRYRDVFRIKLGPDTPAKIDPLAVTPTLNAFAFRSPQLRYSKQQHEFLFKTIKELEAVYAVYDNPESKLACSALGVPKPGSNKLRFTVDLCAANARTFAIHSGMPHFESQLQDIGGSKYFAVLDLAHGYWQVALAEK